MGKLAGKVAIVTGASKGIGAGIAKAFGAEGASVVVNYASSREGADKVVAEITGKGGKASRGRRRCFKGSRRQGAVRCDAEGFRQGRHPRQQCRRL